MERQPLQQLLEGRWGVESLAVALLEEVLEGVFEGVPEGRMVDLDSGMVLEVLGQPRM